MLENDLSFLGWGLRLRPIFALAGGQVGFETGLGDTNSRECPSVRFGNAVVCPRPRGRKQRSGRRSVSAADFTVSIVVVEIVASQIVERRMGSLSYTGPQKEK